jgi:hypothetical protein
MVQRKSIRNSKKLSKRNKKGGATDAEFVEGVSQRLEDIGRKLDRVLSLVEQGKSTPEGQKMAEDELGSSPAVAAPTPTWMNELAVGGHVEYYSTTMGGWTPASVIRVQHTGDSSFVIVQYTDNGEKIDRQINHQRRHLLRI